MQKLTLTTIILTAALSSPAHALFYPHIAVGGVGTALEYRAVVQISNFASRKSLEDSGLFIAGTNGAEWETPWYVDGEPREGYSIYETPRIPAGGSRVFTITGDATVRSGFLNIFLAQNTTNVTTSAFLQVYDNGNLIDTVGILTGTKLSNADYDYIIPVSYKKGEHNTGVAYVFIPDRYGFLGSRYMVWAVLRDATGKRVLTQTGRLLTPKYGDAVHYHHAAFFTELFFPQSVVLAELGDEFVGTLELSCRTGAGISAIALRMDHVDAGIQLTTVPALRANRMGR